MGRNMGLDFGMDSMWACYKRKFRWLFKISVAGMQVSATSVKSLPPSKSARPHLSFKETEVQHLNETVYYPSKPEWKPINLTLYDMPRSDHPVWEWIKKFYDPETGAKWQGHKASMYKAQRATLELYDGCGEVMERWVYENAWPQTADFGDLDMSSSEVVMCDLTLRYDRAYLEFSVEQRNAPPPTIAGNFGPGNSGIGGGNFA